MTAPQTARDAVMDAYRPCTISSPHAAAVLAALGIPPDTPTDDIRAGLTLLRMFAAEYRIQPDTASDGSLGFLAFADQWDGEKWDESRPPGIGASPAAAVLALAARLEERDDA